MRAFIVALCVFFLITGFVAICAISLTDGCDRLVTLAYGFPEDVSENGRDFSLAYDSFTDFWAQERGTVRLFVGHTEADAVDDALDDLKSRADTGDGAGYLSARAKLISSIERIRMSEQFTADALF